MFGESESESPRVPSPWDSLISTPSSPGSRNSHTPSPLSVELIPSLVPESDDGNVEYKLQLLNPSRARFVRLVTQLKWRLLEGGGQAYYELGVADSGDLIGLSRDELEQTLETLEMMAGEIGASVIVVKEIEVPAALAMFARTRSKRTSNEGGLPSSLPSDEHGYSTSTTTETEPDSLSGTDTDEYGYSTNATTGTEADSLSSADADELQEMTKTVTLARLESDDSGQSPIFVMDSETEEVSKAPENPPSIPVQPQFCLELEISSVFKPRPMTARVDNHSRFAHVGGRKRNKKLKPACGKEPTHVPQLGTEVGAEKADKALQRRRNRDRRREEKGKLLEEQAKQSLENAIPAVSPADANTLVVGLKNLHVGIMEKVMATDDFEELSICVHEPEDDSDLFVLSTHVAPSIPTFTTEESYLLVDSSAFAGMVAPDVENIGDGEKRLIVEALVVRKMLHQEAFLDFEGFSPSFFG